MPKLSVHVLAVSERVPTLLDELELPLFYPTLFAHRPSPECRVSRQYDPQQASRSRRAPSLGAASLPDLIAEFRIGRFLTVADVDSLQDFAKLDMRDLKS